MNYIVHLSYKYKLVVSNFYQLRCYPFNEIQCANFLSTV